MIKELPVTKCCCIPADRVKSFSPTRDISSDAEFLEIAEEL